MLHSQNVMLPDGASKHILSTDVTVPKQSFQHCTSKADDRSLNLALLFVFDSPIDFCESGCVTCQTFSSLVLLLITAHRCLRCENYLMVGMLFLNHDSIANKMPLPSAGNKDVSYVKQPALSWFVRMVACFSSTKATNKQFISSVFCHKI